MSRQKISRIMDFLFEELMVRIDHFNLLGSGAFQVWEFRLWQVHFYFIPSRWAFSESWSLIQVVVLSQKMHRKSEEKCKELIPLWLSSNHGCFCQLIIVRPLGCKYGLITFVLGGCRFCQGGRHFRVKNASVYKVPVVRNRERERFNN